MIILLKGSYYQKETITSTWNNLIMDLNKWRQMEDSTVRWAISRVSSQRQTKAPLQRCVRETSKTVHTGNRQWKLTGFLSFETEIAEKQETKRLKQKRQAGAKYWRQYSYMQASRQRLSFLHWLCSHRRRCSTPPLHYAQINCIFFHQVKRFCR